MSVEIVIFKTFDFCMQGVGAVFQVTKSRPSINLFDTPTSEQNLKVKDSCSDYEHPFDLFDLNFATSSMILYTCVFFSYCQVR